MSEKDQTIIITKMIKKKSQTGSSIEAYGFSNTSSELSQKFVINSDTSNFQKFLMKIIIY